MKTVTITGANTFSEVSNELWTTDALTLVFPNAITNVASWRVFGKVATPVTLARTGASGTFTLNYTGRNNISTDYTTVSNGVGTPASTWYMGANSTDGGGNTGFLFSYGAVRYWVGGTGTWDGSTTTNWAYLSGYAGGAPAPTSVTDVYFDGNSDAGVAFTVTLATGNCRYFSIGEFLSLDQNMVLAGTILNAYGSLLFPSTRLTCNIGTINFLAPGLGNTVTTNGVTLSNTTILFNSSTGGWTLGSSLSGTGAFNIAACGMFDTAGYNISNSQIMTYQGISATRNIYLRNSTISDSGYFSQYWNGSGTVVDAGTSTVLAGNGVVANNNSTWYNVTIRAFNGTGSISGNNLTFNTLQFNNIYSSSTWSGSITATNLILGSDVTGVKPIYLGANSSFTNITAGTSTNAGRWNIMSSVLGTPRTITSSVVNLQNVDFQDITAAGAIPWTGTNLGDLGGNTNITFTSKTVYWNLAGTQNWNANGWALTSGGIPAIANFPLAQDTVIFDNAGTATTVTINADYNIGTLDFTNRTTAMTFSGGSVNNLIYGDFLLSPAITLTGNNTVGRWYFVGRGVQRIKTSGIGFNKAIVVSCLGTVQLLDDLTVLPSAYFGFVMASGTLDLNDHILTSKNAGGFRPTSATALLFGTGKVVANICDSGANINMYGSKLVELEDWGGAGGPRIGSYAGTTKTQAANFYIKSVSPTATKMILGDAVRCDNLIIADGISIPLKFGQIGIHSYGDVYIPNSVPEIQPATGIVGGFVFTGDSSHNVTLPPVSIQGFFSVQKSSGDVKLLSNATFTSYCDHRNNGTLNLNGFKISAFSFTSNSTNIRNIDFGNKGILELTGTGTPIWNVATTTNLSVSGTGTINMTSASAKTFAGGGFNYANITLNQGGLGDLTITGANTFSRISNTVRPAKIIFPANTTTTLSEFSISGSSEGQVTLASSTPGTRFTLSKSSGHVAPYNCTISDSSATGGATWRAPANYGNVNGGNNLGWTYNDINTKLNNFFFYFEDVITV